MAAFEADGPIPDASGDMSAELEALAGRYISLTVRTLSGAEIHFPQLGLEMDVAELKRHIHAENEEFPPHMQKLIKGSKILEDDKTLEDYELKNGDTIHLVKRLGDVADAEDELGPTVNISKTGANSNLLTVVVPDNARPGTRLLINPPGREQMSVVVPQGVGPGSRFQVRIPPRQSPTTNTSAGAATDSSAGSIMQVQCPAGARPGQQILIEVPGRGRMRVRVPQNVQPGQMFRFRVPA